MGIEQLQLRPENPPRHGKDSTKATINERKDVEMRCWD